MLRAGYTLILLGIANGCLFAGSTSIGTVQSDSDPSVHNLEEAASVTTTIAGTTVRLRTGGTVYLGPRSRGTFYRDHAVLRDGAAKLDLPPGYAVSARFIDVQPHGPATASLALLSGTVAVAVWGGSVRVISDGSTVVDSMGPGTMIEFSPGPQSPSSGGGQMPARPGGGGPASAGVGNCPAPFCGQGTITIEAGPPQKVYIDDEARGVRYELTGPAVNAAVANGTLKNGQRVSFAGAVLQKADPKTNTGLVVGVNVFAPPSKDPVNVGTFSGVVTKDADGRYWLVDSTTGIRIELSPGVHCGVVDGWIKEGKRKPPRESIVTGKMEPAPKGGVTPTLRVNPCVEGVISREGKAPNQQLFITNTYTGVKTELTVDPNGAFGWLWNRTGQKARVCGFVTNTANPNANTGLKITVTDAANVGTPCKSKSVTGSVSKGANGEYYIEDPVTGVRFQIDNPDAALQKILDAQIDQQDQNKKNKLPPPPDITIEGIIRPPKKGEDYPQIEKPKQVAEANQVEPAGGGHKVVVVTASVAAALLLTGIVVAEEEHHKGPASP